MSENVPLMELVPAEEPEPEDPLVGTTVDGRYLIEGRLGEGGMGVVYKCKHVVLGKHLAMKVLRADVSRDEEIITRFRQEAQSASAIGSQHIIDISDFGTLPEGSTYFVMEYLEGEELTEIIESADPIPTDRLVHIAMQLCDALGAAHERGIVHRDMKPDNVFLVKRPKNDDFVKVLDFGIAKVGGANSKLTKAGQVFGTPHYMSPEQCAGQSVDHRTDIYAVGVILYEMACGQVPFDADNLMGILTKHIYEQPIPPHELPPPVDVPPGLEAVIMKALCKQADQRYQSMADVRADLEAFSTGATPGAVLDAVNRSSAIGLPRVDGTGSHAALTIGVGGVQPDESSKAPVLLGAVVGLLALVAVGLAAYFFALRPDDVVADPPNIQNEPPVANLDLPPSTTPGGGQEERGGSDATEETDTDIEAPTDPPAVAPVMVSVVSTPPGVEVWVVDAEGGETLAGNTPYRIARPASGQFVNLLLKRPGLQDHPIRIGEFTSDEVTVSLSAAPSGGRRSRGSGRRSSRSSRSSAGQPEDTNETPPPDPPVETPPTRRRGGAGVGTEVLDPWARP